MGLLDGITVGIELGFTDRLAGGTEVGVVDGKVVGLLLVPADEMSDRAGFARRNLGWCVTWG